MSDDLNNKIDAIESQINAVESQITSMETEIEEAKAKFYNPLDIENKADLTITIHQLRDKEKQLRDEKKQLRDEKAFLSKFHLASLSKIIFSVTVHIFFL